MTKSGLADILPLSPLQEGLLFHALYDGRAADVYTAQIFFDLDGPLDRASLRAAVDALLRRHANLRVAIRHTQVSQPVQVIPAQVEVPWSEVDLSEHSDSDHIDQVAELERLQAADRMR
ncbi:MAG: condensation domain-containing protein, partial [Sporichthyaceae bacterium]|nr:condensation domain-containing protein [Sporichthyaceae bacterium]